MEHQLLLCFPHGHCDFMEMRTQVALQSFPRNIISSVQTFDALGHIALPTPYTHIIFHILKYFLRFYFYKFALKHEFLINFYFFFLVAMQSCGGTCSEYFYLLEMGKGSLWITELESSISD